MDSTPIKNEKIIHDINERFEIKSYLSLSALLMIFQDDMHLIQISILCILQTIVRLGNKTMKLQ